MGKAFCSWWDCPLEDVAEWQGERCEKDGMTCIDCPFISEAPSAYDGVCEEQV